MSNGLKYYRSKTLQLFAKGLQAPYYSIFSKYSWSSIDVEDLGTAILGMFQSVNFELRLQPEKMARPTPPGLERSEKHSFASASWTASSEKQSWVWADFVDWDIW